MFWREKSQPAGTTRHGALPPIHCWQQRWLKTASNSSVNTARIYWNQGSCCTSQKETITRLGKKSAIGPSIFISGPIRQLLWRQWMRLPPTNPGARGHWSITTRMHYSADNRRINNIWHLYGIFICSKHCSGITCLPGSARQQLLCFELALVGFLIMDASLTGEKTHKNRSAWGVAQPACFHCNLQSQMNNIFSSSKILLFIWFPHKTLGQCTMRDEGPL